MNINEKAAFAVGVLKKYAHENQVPPRSTSDLSKLEQWLILELMEEAHENVKLKEFVEKVEKVLKNKLNT